MAVAVTSSTSQTVLNYKNSGSGTQTYSIATSGDNRGLIVFVQSSMASGLAGSPPASVVYDGTDMVSESNAAIADVRSTAYSLINPSTGTNNLVITWPAATVNHILTDTISFSGVSQSDMVSNITTTTGSSTNTLNLDVTSPASDSIVVAGISVTLFTAWGNRNITVGTGENAAGGSITDTDFAAASYDDAEEDLSTNLVFSCDGGANCVMIAFSVDGPPPTDFAAVNGIAIGDIQAFNGIANSNVQEINNIANKA
jgi:hypothetical protein